MNELDKNELTNTPEDVPSNQDVTPVYFAFSDKTINVIEGISSNINQGISMIENTLKEKNANQKFDIELTHKNKALEIEKHYDLANKELEFAKTQSKLKHILIAVCLIVVCALSIFDKTSEALTMLIGAILYYAISFPFQRTPKPFKSYKTEQNNDIEP